MLRCRKKDKETVIQEILVNLMKFQRVFSHPDLDQWRRLSVPMAQLKSLFLIVNRHGVNSHSLAQDLEVTPGNVTGIIDRLVEQDLVIRKPDPQDRRIIWLEATPQGKDLLNKLREDHSKLIAQILGLMKVSDLGALASGLKGLVEAVESHLDELKALK